jgi:hypothetical protein
MRAALLLSYRALLLRAYYYHMRTLIIKLAAQHKVIKQSIITVKAVFFSIKLYRR